MKVLVCGGRDYTDYKTLCAWLDMVWITQLIEGGAPGADTLAGIYAGDRRIPVRIFNITKADWDKYGNGAGPRRNQQMLDATHPDLVVAFPGHKGTLDMVTRAREQGYAVEEFV